MRIVLMLAAVGVIGASARAQSGDKWEISGLGGVSMYRDVTASGTNPNRSAKAGFFNGAAAGVALSQGGGQHWGGEFHYLFQTNNMRLRSPTGETGAANFNARSHSLHYDVLLYATRRDSRLRPYIAGGPGLKLYQASGAETAFQPLSDIVVLSRRNQTKFLVSGGGGVKFRFLKNAVIRADFRDYVTGIPKNFAAFPGVRLSGQFHNFVVTGGVGVVF